MHRRINGFYEHYLLSVFSKRNFSGAYQGSRERIFKVFNNPNATRKEKTDILIKEYGIGGFGYKGYNESYNSKGIELSVLAISSLKFKYTWSEVVDMIESGGDFCEKWRHIK